MFGGTTQNAEVTAVKHSKKAFLSLAVLSLVVPKCFSHPPRQPSKLALMEEAKAELAAPWLIAVYVRGRGLAAVLRLSDRIQWQQEMILVVSVYNYTGLSEPQLRHAEEVAGRIFGEAQIQVRWLRCRNSQAEPAIAVSCKAPLAATELILRILSLVTGRQ